MTNPQIAAIFDEIADFLEFQDANQFRVRAYRNAARTINDLARPLAEMVPGGVKELTTLDGIGKDLAEKIITLVTTGELPQHRELQAQIPQSVLALLRVPSLGPKKAAALFRELKITTLDELRAACEQQRVRELKGFGAKTEEAILAGIGLAATSSARMYWAEADIYAQALRTHLEDCPDVEQFELAGSYRRGRETIGDLDVLAVSRNVDAVMDHFGKFIEVASVQARGDTKMSVRLGGGLQVDLRVVPAESFGAALQYFTGSKEHNVVLRGLAKARGLKINEYGVFRGEEYVAGRTEAEVYATLDLPWFPPELREARREFDWAAGGQLPELIELGDLRGDLHMHTTETDGEATLEETAEAAKARGLKFIAITDHSKRVSMARGMDGPRLLKQWKEIDRLNTRLKGIKLLKGVEVDILERGGLDLDDDVLCHADWVVASIHYGQNQSREQLTSRMVGALENPNVSAIAHPTGRIINRRKSYELDLEAVFAAAKAHGKFLELNANPARLDLDDVCCAAAKSHGIPIVISSDAHSVSGLDVLRYGILQARRGGLTKQDVVNTRTWPEIKKLGGKREA
ncbi:MAG: DNA polymerase/3'-5' exonuclease PolX [Planctomycetes bacterium]|nr:DNA polymerase/3'-5' exonuclease PolX [Planctomycetota bacterium]